MATLLNSISFVFKISFLPKYRVIYYDYTVNWCRLINCNWCALLDIVNILAIIDLFSSETCMFLTSGIHACDARLESTDTRTPVRNGER